VIEKLTVKDVAVVEHAEIVFDPGLNVVTGETGAGKSVLIGAIDLLCGGRADHSLIRQGASQASVMAEFVLDPGVAGRLTPILEDAGIDPCEENRLILRRTIAASGSGRALVNNCPATLQVLRRIGERLVDLHGPHDNQSLLNPLFQLDALDAFGQCQGLRTAFSSIWRERRGWLKRRDALSADGDAVARELDVLRHQVREISDAQLSVETDGEALAVEHAEAANAAEILEAGNSVMERLSDGDGAAVDVMASVIRALETLQRTGAREAAPWLEEARAISIQLNELSRGIATRLSRMEVSPERMQWLDDRLTQVERLKRKYGRSVEAVLAFGGQAAARLADLETREEQIADIDRTIAAVDVRLDAAAQALQAARAKASDTFAQAVSAQLSDLGLPHAAFQVALSPAETDRETGREDVAFGFAPNPGEAMRPLRTIASSGEISRVMLALKTVLAGHDNVPVLVFDEIDANVGGEIANTVGGKLADVAGLHQVVCITHLPQVAVWGRRHFAVTKHIVGGRTQTHIRPVADEARVGEIARMLGGADLTSVTLEHARELLARAQG